ncbi:MAG: phytoene desaturase family protein, partial [Candidatus Hadarchaeum sp.]
MSKPVVIIGAGLGGLSAAIHLAAKGRHVLVVEQNTSVGGKMGEIRDGGYRWDTGPSVITMRHVLESLFQAAGRSLDGYMSLRSIDPLTRYFYPDGTVLDATNDLPRMLSRIQALEPADVDGYRRFLDYAATLHRVTGPVFIYDRPPTLRCFLKVSPLDVLRVDGLRTMAAAQRSFVRSPHLRQLLGRFATYVGASPYLAPATLNVIAHVELSQGVWYPEGGVYSIARAYERLACELGVTIQTGCPARQILVTGGRAHGILLADGQYIEASAVIANVDVATVYEELLPPGVPDSRRLARFRHAEPSCSGFILLLGVRRQHSDLAHHNIF